MHNQVAGFSSWLNGTAILRIAFFASLTISNAALCIEAGENIVAPGRIANLLSSKDVAELPPGVDIDDLAQEKAQNICARLGKKFISFELVDFTDIDSGNPIQDLAYRAWVLNSGHPPTWSEYAFALRKFPQKKSYWVLVRNGLWATASTLFVGGGYAALVTGIEIEGQANPMAAGIIGGVTAFVSSAIALGGAYIHCKKCNTAPKILDDEELVFLPQGASEYAMPVLATGIYCR